MKKSLTVEDICAILGSCDKNGVAALKFGDLQVEFFDKQPETSVAHTSAPEIAAEQSKIHNSALVEEEIRTREQQLEELFLTDPLEAERLLAKGDLEDELNGTEE
jgi:hypothetical protein